MDSKYSIDWNKLYDIFIEAKIKGIELYIDRDDEIYITVKNIERMESGCHSCKTKYECFCISGKIRSKDLYKVALPYYADISQYNMHKCTPEEKVPDGFNPLFRGYVEETQHSVCHRVLDLNFIDGTII